MRAPEPYFKARLRELRESGLALPRTHAIQRTKRDRFLQKAAKAFVSSLRRAPVAAYFVGLDCTVSFRRVGSRKALDLPRDARLIGTYFEADGVKEQFLADLVATMRATS